MNSSWFSNEIIFYCFIAIFRKNLNVISSENRNWVYSDYAKSHETTDIIESIITTMVDNFAEKRVGKRKKERNYKSQNKFNIKKKEYEIFLGSNYKYCAISLSCSWHISNMGHLSCFRRYYRENPSYGTSYIHRFYYIMGLHDVFLQKRKTPEWRQ